MSPSLGVLLLVVILSSCHTATPDVPAVAPPASPPGPTVAEPPPPPSTTASAAPSANAPVDTRVHDACAKLCEHVKKGCTKERADACLEQCPARESRAKGCESETEAALLCQTNVPDSFCHDVASPRCGDAFLRMARCQRGEPEPVSAPAPELPPGWERAVDETWGVSFAMPQGAAIDATAKARTWKATADGATYEVVELPKPAKLDDTALIKLVIKHVGVGCQRGMSLTGRVDTDTLMFVRYDTGCGHAERLHGKLYVDGKHALSMLVRGEPKSDLIEFFLESVR